jgi:hypothetical protein
MKAAMKTPIHLPRPRRMTRLLGVIALAVLLLAALLPEPPATCKAFPPRPPLNKL